MCADNRLFAANSPPIKSIPAWTFHGCNLEQILFLRLYESVDECTSPLVKHLPRVDDPFMQSRTTPLFRALQVGRRVHQSTSRTPPTHGQSMYAIQNNSSFLRHFELVDERTSPLAEHLPRVADPCMQSRMTPRF